MQVSFSLFETQNSDKFNWKCFGSYQRIITMDVDSRYISSYTHIITIFLFVSTTILPYHPIDMGAHQLAHQFVLLVA